MHQQSPPEDDYPPMMPSLKQVNGAYPPPGQGFFYPGHNQGMASAFQSIYPLAKELLSSKSVSRRTKRMVPNEHKDDRYWEKRKRNNDAARRSRENKRQLEMDMRARAIFLEEENALLRKEVTVLKTKFSLNPESRYLALDNNGELVPSSVSTTLSSLEEAITNELQSKVENECAPPLSPNSSLAISSADVEGSSSDDYVPMKKRKRPKLEAEMSYSAGSSASSMSPSGSVGTPHYSSHSNSFNPSEDNRSPSQDHGARDSPPPSAHSYSDERSYPIHSYPNSIRDSYQNGFRQPSTDEAPPEIYNSLPHHHPVMSPYPVHGKLPGLHFIRMMAQSPRAPSDQELPNSMPASSPPRCRSPPEPEREASPKVDESAVQRENDAIRCQLQQLSEEVARMKNFVLQSKDRDLKVN